MNKWPSFNTEKIKKNIYKVFRYKDIEHLNLDSYNLLYGLSGFIAHYDINGFKDYYKDLRVLINDLKRSYDLTNTYINRIKQVHSPQKEYYFSKIKTIEEIKHLIIEHEGDINLFFSHMERKNDISTIERLKAKHSI